MPLAVRVFGLIFRSGMLQRNSRKNPSSSIAAITNSTVEGQEVRQTCTTLTLQKPWPSTEEKTSECMKIGEKHAKKGKSHFPFASTTPFSGTLSQIARRVTSCAKLRENPQYFLFSCPHRPVLVFGWPLSATLTPRWRSLLLMQREAQKGRHKPPPPHSSTGLRTDERRANVRAGKNDKLNFLWLKMAGLGARF